MAEIFTRGIAERAAPADGTPGMGEVHFVLSTAGVKRDGLDLSPDRWRFDRYNTNPVLLVNHDYSKLPIGTARVYVENGAVKFEPRYDAGDPFAMEVKRKVDAGYLNTSSAGWGFVNEDGTPFTGRDITNAYYDLLDVSLVTVPADPSAGAERMRAARALLDQAERIMTGEADVTEVTTVADTTVTVESTVEFVTDATDGQPVAAEPDTWERVSAAMVDVFKVTGDDADDKQRRRRYNALLPKYRRLDKFPPEFLSADELRALGPDEWRGLWLEGEVSERAGAVLNSRNRTALIEARDRIDAVLASADKGEAGATPDGSRAMTAAEAATLAQGMTALAQSMATLAAGLVTDEPASAPESIAEAAAGAEIVDLTDEPNEDEAVLDEVLALLGGA